MELKIGDTNIENGIESTVVDIDSKTGAITWDIDYTPDYKKLYKEISALLETAKEVYLQTKDPFFKDHYNDVRKTRNQLRTYLRNNKKEVYDKIKQMSEISVTGGSASFTSNTGTGMHYAAPLGYKKVKDTDSKKNNMYKYKLNLKENSREQFQQRRINAFDEIERELNNLFPILSNAKKETIDYYQDKPSTFEVVYPTDLIKDYIKDIKELLPIS